MKDDGDATNSASNAPEPHIDADPFRAQPSSYAASEQYLVGFYEGPPPAETLWLAMTSFALGMTALALAVIVATNALFGALPNIVQMIAELSFILSPLLAVIAVILGHVSYVQADRTRLRGRGMAVAGFITGYASLLIGFLALVLPDSGPVPGIV